MSKDFIYELLNNQAGDYSGKTKKVLEKYTRENVNCPVLIFSIGTSSLIAGVKDSIAKAEEYLREHAIEAELVNVGGKGFLSAEPVLEIKFPGRNRIAFAEVYPDRVFRILDGIFHHVVDEDFVLGQYFEGALAWEGVPDINDHPFFSGQTRFLMKNCGVIDPESIEEYIARGGYRSFVKSIRHYTSQEIIDIVEKSGLRGRSGSGYYTAQKFLKAYNAYSDTRYLVCNADESDPGGFMDRVLIEGDPHLIVEGVGLAAYAIGANKAYIYIRSRYTLAVSRLEKALSDARESGLLGEDIMNSGYNLNIEIKKGPGAYVCGEETALIQSIQGERGMPRSKPPYPTETGLFGKPSVISNVKTFANIPEIIAKGPAWFRKTGTKDSYGTKIFSIAGNARYMGVVEVPMGYLFESLIFKNGGGVKEGRSFKSVLSGGPSGYFLSREQLNIALDYSSFDEAGLHLGAGGVIVLDDQQCIVSVNKYFMDFFRNESCGKCIPCREGSKRMYEILEKVTRRPAEGKGHETLERFKGITQIENIAQVMKETSLCGLGVTAPNLLLSSMKLFREEFEEHIFDRQCRAGVCRHLRLFYIDPEECTGCNVCLQKCPEDAILGVPKKPHYINQEKCIGCGICYDVCKFNAISIK